MRRNCFVCVLDPFPSPERGWSDHPDGEESRRAAPEANQCLHRVSVCVWAVGVVNNRPIDIDRLRFHLPSLSFLRYTFIEWQPFFLRSLSLINNFEANEFRKMVKCGAELPVFNKSADCKRRIREILTDSNHLKNNLIKQSKWIGNKQSIAAK